MRGRPPPTGRSGRQVRCEGRRAGVCLSVCLGAPVSESRPRLEPGCPLMRARWGHTSPVGRHLPALISDKGLSVPRTPALPHSSPATTSLSKPPLITRRGAGTGEARPGGGRSSDSLRPSPNSAAQHSCTPTQSCTPTPPTQDPDPTEGARGSGRQRASLRCPASLPGRRCPPGVPGDSGGGLRRHPGQPRVTPCSPLLPPRLFYFGDSSWFEKWSPKASSLWRKAAKGSVGREPAPTQDGIRAAAGPRGWVLSAQASLARQGLTDGGLVPGPAARRGVRAGTCVLCPPLHVGISPRPPVGRRGKGWWP